MSLADDYALDRDAMQLIRAGTAQRMYVIGGVDTGKTTLAAGLADLLSADAGTAEVDLDAGQARIGLPTTFAWRMAGDRAPAGMYFAGNTSPAGQFDISVAGSAVMVGDASAAADKVVIDTCGLAKGDAGRRLHHTTIDAVRADLVIGIQRGGELEGLLGPLEHGRRPRVIRARVPDAVKPRSRATRRSYRARKFRAYFEEAQELRLPLSKTGILRPRRDPRGRIASLRGRDGRDAALAIVRAYDSPRGTITVLTPAAERAEVASVVLGSLRIARDGRQLAREA
ncbi:MAG: Clp1/GlmU family protein [Planctomycetota bacterium]